MTMSGRIMTKTSSMFRRIQIQGCVFVGCSCPLYKQSMLHNFYPFNDIQVRHAGHSKWANIKHTKELKDSEKGALRTKFSQLIKVAIREGGGIVDPKINSQLADAIEQAKAAKVPNENIQKMLAVKPTKAAAFAVKYGSTVIMAEVESDNINRTRTELTHMTKKMNCIVADASSANHIFKHVGVIRCSEYKGNPVNESQLDESIDHALECGADDVQIVDSDDGRVYEFLTQPNPSSFYAVQDALTKLDYKVIYSELEYQANSPVSLDDEQLEFINLICQKLMSHQEVVRLHDNIA